MALLASNPSSRRSLTVRWVWLVLCLLATAPLPAQTNARREYQVKAVFLFNFAQFVDWPASAFADPAAPLIVGVLGTDPFGPDLDDVVRGESVGTHPLEIKYYARAEDIEACHILFISGSEAPRLDKIVNQLDDRPILTVSDTDNAARRGVMIRFFSDNGRIRLRVNLEASRQAGLQISSKILRRAEIVDNGKQP